MNNTLKFLGALLIIAVVLIGIAAIPNLLRQRAAQEVDAINYERQLESERYKDLMGIHR